MYTYKLIIYNFDGIIYLHKSFLKKYYFIILSICVKFQIGPSWYQRNLLIYRNY